VGTAISFSLFGLGGLFLGLLVFPVLFVVQRDATKRQRISRCCIGQAVAWFIGLMKALGVLDYRILNCDRLEGHSGTHGISSIRLLPIGSSHASHIPNSSGSSSFFASASSIASSRSLR
jgi:hypothetical protein